MEELCDRLQIKCIGAPISLLMSLLYLQFLNHVQVLQDFSQCDVCISSIDAIINNSHVVQPLHLVQRETLSTIYAGAQVLAQMGRWKKNASSYKELYLAL